MVSSGDRSKLAVPCVGVSRGRAHIEISYHAAVEHPNQQSVSEILAGFAVGDRGAIEALLPRVYSELRRLAAVHLRADRQGHTLQPTALVHEAYIRLADGAGAGVTGKLHFFRLASKLMRQILVDHARAHDAQKRGGNAQRITLDGLEGGPGERPLELLALEEALGRLEKLSPRKAQLVELRFYGGLSEEQAAGALSISRTQASREWRMARAWLADELADERAHQMGGESADEKGGEPRPWKDQERSAR